MKRIDAQRCEIEMCICMETPPMPNAFGAEDYIALPEVPTRPAPSPPSDDRVNDDMETREAPRSTSSSLLRLRFPSITTHIVPKGKN